MELGGPSVPVIAANAVLEALPFLSRSPSLPSTRSSSSPPSPSPTVPIPTAAAHLTVTAYLTISAPDFDATAGALFAASAAVRATRLRRVGPLRPPSTRSMLWRTG